MPEVYVYAVEGRSIEQKRGLVKESTDAVVRNFNVSPDAVMVQIVESARSELDDAEVVITMLPGGEHVLSVWDDIVPAARQGTLFIDCSSIDVASARKAHALAADGKVSAIIVGGMPFAVAGFVSLINPSYMQEFLHNPRGPYLLGLVALLLMCGLVSIRWLIERSISD